MFGIRACGSFFEVIVVVIFLRLFIVFVVCLLVCVGGLYQPDMSQAILTQPYPRVQILAPATNITMHQQ